MKVIISERAEQNLDSILRYLETEWSIKVRDRFLKVLKAKIDQIAKTPLMYEASSKRKSVRKCVVSRQTSLYYRASKEEIEIITIQGNRQDPKKLKL